MTHKAPQRIAVLVAALAVWHPGAHGADNPTAAQDLSLEELLRVDVTTASRKAQAVQDVAAAVFVITRDDIERSGSTSIPEVLRMAPGVEVARLSSGRWAVSARGFNGRFANKLLVLMDGRSIYSPLFSGVLWEMEGTLLEDIERIEIIRGPGAALWGANAVNGVINIITRHTRDTQGGLVAVGAGNVENGSVAARYGSTLGNGFYRLWAKTESQRSFEDAAGHSGNNGSRTSRAGFRADMTLASGSGLSLSGGMVSNVAGDRWNVASLTAANGVAVTDTTQTNEAVHLLSRYSRLGGDGSETIVQAYVEQNRILLAQAFEQRRTTVDLDVQHRPRLSGAHDIVFGANYRFSGDEITTTTGSILQIDPKNRDFTLTSVFINDEITLVPDRLRATLGARLEHTSFTGLEPQPHARLAWTPSRTQTFWTAVSRAVRTPSRAEPDATVDLAVAPPSAQVPFPVLLRNVPPANRGKVSETVNALEFGYRQQVDTNLSLDVTAFHNYYSRLSGARLGPQQIVFRPFPYVVQEAIPANNLEGRTWGLELAMDWRPQRAWRIQGAYSYLKAEITPGTPGDAVELGSATRLSNSAPQHQVMLRSSVSLGNGREMDAKVRYVSAIQADASGVAPVDAYTSLDLRYAWRPLPKLTLSVTGENLLNERHAEFVPDLLPSQLLVVPRSVYFKALWQF